MKYLRLLTRRSNWLDRIDRLDWFAKRHRGELNPVRVVFVEDIAAIREDFRAVVTCAGSDTTSSDLHLKVSEDFTIGFPLDINFFGDDRNCLCLLENYLNVLTRVWSVAFTIGLEVFKRWFLFDWLKTLPVWSCSSWITFWPLLSKWFFARRSFLRSLALSLFKLPGVHFSFHSPLKLLA